MLIRPIPKAYRTSVLLTMLTTVSQITYAEADYFSMPLEQLLTIEVTTTSKYRENANDSPANIIVLTQSEIRQRGYRNLEDILRGLPGVTVNRFTQFSPFNTVVMHGNAGNNKFLILQDGVRIDAAGGENTPVSHNFPVYHAKQVEILLGPASVVYGADAFAGVINIITHSAKDSTAQELALNTGPDGYLNLYAQSHQHFGDKIHLNMGAYGYQSEDLDFSEGYAEIGFPNQNGTTASVDFSEMRAYNLFATLDIGKHLNLGLNHSSFQAPTYLSGRPDANAFDPDAREQVLLTSFYTKYSAEITKAITSTTLAGYMRYEMDNDTQFNNIFTGFKPVYKYALSERFYLNQDFNYQLNANHLISLGFAYDYTKSIPIGPDLPERYNESAPIDNQHFNYPDTDLPIALYQSSEENLGAFIQDNWLINSKWRVVAGVRFDHNTFYGDTTNPRLAVMYHHNKHSLKLLYGHSFLAPSADLIYRNFGAFSQYNEQTSTWESNFFRAPNLKLAPEKLKSFEVAYNYQLSQNSSFSFTPYYTTIEDVINVTSDETPQQFIPGATIFFTESNKNVGENRLYGADLSFHHRIEKDGWRINNTTSISYVDGYALESETKRELPLITPWSFKLATTLVYNNTYTLTPKLYWNGQSNNQQLSNEDPTERLHSDPYAVVDIHGEMKLNPSLKLVSDIYNLFDSHYTNAMSQGTNLTLEQAPQTGRQVTIGIVYGF